MTTIVNNPAPTQGNGGTGFLFGIVIFVLFVLALLYFGIPAIRNRGPIQVNVPAVEINVPTPEVNVQAPKAPTPTE